MISLRNTLNTQKTICNKNENQHYILDPIEMKRPNKNALIPLIVTTLITLFIYAFALLRGQWAIIFMAFIFIIGISNYLDEYTGKRYFLRTLSILISVFIFTLLYVSTVRNNSSETISVEGVISRVNNNYKYVHFELKEYPDITFKSYDAKIRNSFKEYDSSKYYEKIPVNIGKKAKMEVFKSHLEWYRKPLINFLKNLRFPLEVEIESFEIIE